MAADLCRRLDAAFRPGYHSPMKRRPLALVYMTAPDSRCANRIADALVAGHLAACVNLIPGMQSVYRWKGRIERADEVVLVAKTTRSRLNALVSEVRKLHPYECPCVAALTLVGGHAPFLDWIEAETRPARTSIRAARGRPVATTGRG